MSLLAPRVGIGGEAAHSGHAPADDFYAKWTVGAAVFLATLEIFYLVLAGLPPASGPWLDSTHFLIGRDFINTWMGGRAAWAGGPAALFDLPAYNAQLHQLFGANYPEHFWVYPPHVVLFMAPFGLLPYLPAYLAWCVIGVALYLWACVGGLPRRQLWFLAVAPGVAVCIFFGQNGFYTAALLIAGLVNLERRPVLAGVLFGILTIKPQLGLLLPVMLLFERRWLTIASALVTAALLAAATTMLYGATVWIEFWRQAVPIQQWLTSHGQGLLFAMMGSVFYGARLLHLPVPVGWALQGTVAALAIAAVVWTYWRRRDPALSLSLLVTATFLVTPYILNYDMVVLGFVVALLRERADNTMRDHWLLVAVWTLPVTMMIAAAAWIPLAPIVLIAFAARLVWRLKQSDEHEIANDAHRPAFASA